MKYRESIILLFLLTLFFCVAAFAEQESDIGWVSTIKVNPYGGEEDDVESIVLFQTEGMDFLFLPADTDEERICIWHDDSFGLIVDGQARTNGEPCPELACNGIHTISQDDEKDEPLSIQVLRSTNLPSVFISTETRKLDYIHESQDNSETGELRIHQNGTVIHSLDIQQFKGRGNATWGYPKKPYSIKFKDPVDLLGMPEARRWNLLANYCDPTLQKNAIAWDLAEAVGLYYTSDYRYADLYINGDYLGNYIICEKVEVGENRVSIDSLENDNEALNGKLPVYAAKGSGEDGEILSGDIKGSMKWVDLPEEPEEITGGYLVELDMPHRYGEELCGFVTDNGQCVVIKAPEHSGKKETEYISSLVNHAFEALYSSTGYNDEGKHYTDYFDQDSFVAMYIIREFGNDIDAGLSSTYINKPRGEEKLYFSPIWDMDRAFGDHLIRFGLDYGDPCIWWANSLYNYVGENRIPTVFNAAYRHTDFRESVQRKWEQIKASRILNDQKLHIDEREKNNRESATMDAIRWNLYGIHDISSINRKYNKACQDLIGFITAREKSLDKGFSDDTVMLYYDSNGGNGGVFNSQILSKGEKTTVSWSKQGETEILPPNDESVFSHWNTKADGSGETYFPEDEIIVTGETVLFAQWTRK